MTRKKSQEEFIEEAKVIHGDRYDYTNTIFKGYHDVFSFRCKNCGKLVTLTPCHHIREGIGCQNCYPTKCTWTKRRTKEEFIEKVQKIHGNGYDYSEIESTEANAFVTIKCNNCGNKFKQRIREHLRGSGCNNIKCIRKHVEETCLEKHGDKHYINIEKIKQTCIKKYGVENAMQNKDIVKKGWQTKKRNGTTSSSKPEKEILKLLQNKFHNVFYNYKTNIYPFYCDFYIPCINAYIEYQGHQSHGYEPYDPDNLKHQNIIKEWLLRAEKIEKERKDGKLSQYRKYIKIWTISDPLKRQTAADNNLNWLEFFTMDEFMDWYEKV